MVGGLVEKFSVGRFQSEERQRRRRGDEVC